MLHLLQELMEVLEEEEEEELLPILVELVTDIHQIQTHPLHFKDNQHHPHKETVEEMDGLLDLAPVDFMLVEEVEELVVPELVLALEEDRVDLVPLLLLL